MANPNKTRRTVGSGAKRKHRRDHVLDAASALFNEAGAAGVSLGDVARTLNLTRAAVYYYVPDRDGLLEAIFARTLDQLDAGVVAGRAADSGLEAVETFIATVLAPDAPVSAMVSELSVLPENRRAPLETRLRRALTSLAGFIERGAADGSVRPLDPAATAAAIFGAAAWTPLARGWRGCETRREALRDGLIDLFRHGVRPAAAACTTLRWPDPVSLTARTGNLFDPAVLQALKREQLLRTASQAFNADGIAGTSLEDVAARLGATRGALYHYVPDKPALVGACMERGFDLYERIAEIALAGEGDAAEKFLTGLGLNVAAQLGDTAPFAAVVGLASLPEELQRPLARRASALDGLYVNLVDQGLAAGEIRPLDRDALLTAAAGAVSWASRAARRLAVNPLTGAKCFTDIFARGLCAR